MSLAACLFAKFNYFICDILELNAEEVTRECRKLYKFISSYYLGGGGGVQIKDCEMGWSYRTNAGDEACIAGQP